jgi:catechol 2,3-dioxygenase-like lactoylglutathione lyase family enzyme
MKVGAVQHIGVSVSNMEEALGFYRDLLGLEVMMDMEMTGDAAIEALLGVRDIKMRYVLFSGKGALLNLLEVKQPRGENVARKLRPQDHAIHHIAFSVDDVDAAYEELKASGVEFLSPPQDTGLARAVSMRGPDGVIVELFQIRME